MSGVTSVAAKAAELRAASGRKAVEKAIAEVARAEQEGDDLSARFWSLVVTELGPVHSDPRSRPPTCLSSRSQ
ncbi:hypothetical protein GCM10011380_10630 [Sphingomonas metalli]|uniref:Uncharacterized protein n=1 Tax=Sphingomonas metalli TaxID=1779358 RepID=A0A916WQF3_9SPHN|nr:hypothetical protein GCM10011380_10630 [Sphingomonas metalli]